MSGTNDIVMNKRETLLSKDVYSHRTYIPYLQMLYLLRKPSLRVEIKKWVKSPKSFAPLSLTLLSNLKPDLKVEL